MSEPKEWKLMPVEPSAEMLDRATDVVTGFSGEYGTYIDYLSEDAAREVYQAFRSVAPAVQGEAEQPPLQLPDFATDPDDSDEVASLWDHGFKRGWNSCLGAVAKAMQPAEQEPASKFKHGDLVRKIKGSQWKGRVVGTYSTELTTEGYAVESDTEKGSVQIYPAAALELATDDEQRAPAAPDVSALVEALEWIAGADCEPGEGATDFAVAMGRGIAIGNIHRKASEALAAYWKGGEQ